MSEVFSDSINNNAGFLVVQRKRSGGSGYKPALPLNPEEILKKYRGIEGDVWLSLVEDSYSKCIEIFESCLAPLGQTRQVTEYYERMRKKYCDEIIDLIYCQRGDSKNTIIPEGYEFCGYDYGYLMYNIDIDDTNVFSVIYNEIIYGFYKEMKDFASMLNKNLLFDSIEIIKQVYEVRTQLLADGCSLEEDDEEPVSFAIYAPFFTER